MLVSADERQTVLVPDVAGGRRASLREELGVTPQLPHARGSVSQMLK
jgi:hypothetical protein